MNILKSKTVEKSIDESIQKIQDPGFRSVTSTLYYLYMLNKKFDFFFMLRFSLAALIIFVGFSDETMRDILWYLFKEAIKKN